MEIRTVDAHEAAVCTRLGDAVRESYMALAGHVDEPGYEAELADVAGRCGLPDTVVLAAFDAGEPLGCVTYVDTTDSPMSELDVPGAAQIRMLGVDRAAQGTGVGRALVAACLDRARADGKQRVVLNTTPWMLTAQRIYESMGFERDPSLDWTPVPDISLLGYRLELS